MEREMESERMREMIRKRSAILWLIPQMPATTRVKPGHSRKQVSRNSPPRNQPSEVPLGASRHTSTGTQDRKKAKECGIPGRDLFAPSDILNVTPNTCLKTGI